MKPRSETFKTLPLGMVNGNTFGRYPKISVSQTFNLIESDGWLVDYAGYSLVATLLAGGVGRGIYKSAIQNVMIVVISNTVFLVNSNVSYSIIGFIGSATGDVFIAEDIQGQIAICDKTAIWIYDPTRTPAFFEATLPLGFIPGYVAFHDGRFVAPNLQGTSQANADDNGAWQLSNPSAVPSNSVWPGGTQYVGEFQTKADFPVAVVPFPGHSNLLFVMGNIVTELWYDQGLQLFPYQRSASVNIDYGCANADTIAYLDNYLCWIGYNERAGASVMVSTGGVPERISNDGIDYVLAQLKKPQDAHGFMIRQDGHIIYQFCFPTDNVSYIYDFNTKKFFTVTDPHWNYHIAKKAVFFNGTYYFVAINDGNLYEMSSSDTTYNGQLIPRCRIMSTVREPNSLPFICNNVTFPVEQGVDSILVAPSPLQIYPDVPAPDSPGVPLVTEDYQHTIATEGGTQLATEGPLYTGKFSVPPLYPQLPCIDMAVSRNGGYTFSSYKRTYLNPQGYQVNRFIEYNLGWSNELVLKFEFWSAGRIVVGEGTMDTYA